MKPFFKFIYTLIMSAVAAVSCQEAGTYISLNGYAQGGIYTVKFNMEGIDTDPEEIAGKVESILADIDKSLSGYNRNSLLSSFNNGLTINPDSLFVDIYTQAWSIWEETDGAVDAASAPLFDLWGFGFKSGNMPDDEKVAATIKISGMHRLHNNMKASIAPDGTLNGRYLLKEAGQGPELNYNAIAQGYSCDVVARYLYSLGVKDMMVDIGEIFCDGLNPSGKPWTLGIDKPVDGNNSPGAELQGIFRVPEGPHGIVTSGNYRKFYIKDGRKYAHTIDPRTGYPVSHNLLSATIVAENATLADAYATYCMVIGLEKAKEFLESRQDLEGCLVYDEDGIFKTWTSEGFRLEESE
jgi:thiamine biosynthesis lipoprotein